MTFLEFCQTHGLIVHAIRTTAPGQTVRTPTRCAPKAKAGWYRYDGRTGACGIWRGLDNCAQNYTPGADAAPMTTEEAARYAQAARDHEAKVRAGYASAALRAAAILKRAEMANHDYIARKGFPNLLTPTNCNGEICLVSLWIGGRLVNLQRINRAGDKRFLQGGEIIGAHHTIGYGGVPMLCEGYATALSTAAGIRAGKLRAHAVMCINAGNLIRVAESMPGGVIVADNDASGTGELAAKRAGLPYWMPPDVESDANDYHKSAGIFALSQALAGLVRRSIHDVSPGFPLA